MMPTTKYTTRRERRLARLERAGYRPPMWEKPLTPFEIEVEEVKARMWDDDFDSVVEALPPMVITPLIDGSTAKFVRILRRCCEDVVPEYAGPRDFNNAKIVRIKAILINCDAYLRVEELAYKNIEVCCEVNGKPYTPSCHPPVEFRPFVNDDDASTDDDDYRPSPPREPKWYDGGVITHTELARLAWCIKNETLWNFGNEGLYMIKSIDVL